MSSSSISNNESQLFMRVSNQSQPFMNIVLPTCFSCQKTQAVGFSCLHCPTFFCSLAHLSSHSQQECETVQMHRLGDKLFLPIIQEMQFQDAYISVIANAFKEQFYEAVANGNVDVATNINRQMELVLKSIKEPPKTPIRPSYDQMTHLHS
jgi:hypothetical protein